MNDSSFGFRAIESHIGSFFQGHTVTPVEWHAESPHGQGVRHPVRVLEIAPGPRTRFWTYLSVGAWKCRSKPRHEFFLISPSADPGVAELVGLMSHYHGQEGLGFGHALALGTPWKRGSLCSSMLVTWPGCYATDLWVCKFERKEVEIAWLVPITDAERQFAVTRGLEALEELMEKGEIKYWDPYRSCVVTGASPLDA